MRGQAENWVVVGGVEGHETVDEQRLGSHRRQHLV